MSSTATMKGVILAGGAGTRLALDHGSEQLLRRLGEMEADVLEGFWGDAGESIDAYSAVNDFVRNGRRE